VSNEVGKNELICIAVYLKIYRHFKMAQSFVHVDLSVQIHRRYEFIQARSNYMYLTIILFISCCQIQTDKL